MATVSVDLFVPEIAPSVLGCPEPLIKEAIVASVRDFCEQSQFWRERPSAVTVTDASFPYSIPAPAHGEFNRVLSLHCGTAKLVPTSYDDLDAVPEWDTHTGDPAAFLITHDDRLVLYPRLAGEKDMRMTVVYTAARGATVVEEVLYKRWRDAIVSGALAKLMAMPDKGWSKPDMVGLHGSRFANGVQEARVEADTSNRAKGSMSVSPRPLA